MNYQPPPPGPPQYAPPPPPGAPVYELSGWWRRVGATILDGFVVWFISFILSIPFSGASFYLDSTTDSTSGAAAGFAFDTVGTLISIAVYILLIPLVMAKTDGRTIGKMATGIRVVRETGEPVEFGYAIYRELLIKNIVFGFLGVFTLGIAWLLNYLWPLWDEQNRALHDKIAKSRVVRFGVQPAYAGWGPGMQAAAPVPYAPQPGYGQPAYGQPAPPSYGQPAPPPDPFQPPPPVAPPVAPPSTQPQASPPSAPPPSEQPPSYGQPVAPPAAPAPPAMPPASPPEQPAQPYVPQPPQQPPAAPPPVQQPPQPAGPAQPPYAPPQPPAAPPAQPQQPAPPAGAPIPPQPPADMPIPPQPPAPPAPQPPAAPGEYQPPPGFENPVPEDN